MDWIILIVAVPVVVIAAIGWVVVSRVADARRLSKHLDSMQAAE